jgi:hypothetical protein
MDTVRRRAEAKHEEVTRPMRDPNRSRDRGSDGFALILAILALMLLTSLGIALSVTTTTEVQIAANYKWSQQALYNAEAGIQIARDMLGNRAAGGFAGRALSGILPARRATTWKPTDPPPPNCDQPNAPGVPIPVDSSATRNFENCGCDFRGHGAGYGAVLSVGGTTWENISTYGGKRLPGSFTLWIRRPLEMSQAGDWADYSSDDETAVITSEGAAPFSGEGMAAGLAFVQENRAVRVVEMLVTLRPRICDPGNIEQTGEGETNTRSASCGIVE